MNDWRVIVDSDDAQRRLDRIALGLTDLRSFWPIVTRLWISWESRLFDTEGAFAGSRWAPLSASYAAWKALHFPGRPILSATGALRRAATTPRRRATPTMLVLSVEPYSREGRTVQPSWFEEGTSRMPARPIVFGSPLPAQASAELEAAADAYVRDLLSRF